MTDSCFHKKSLKLQQIRTSIALEGDFWEGLQIIATQRGISLPELVREIEAARVPNAHGKKPGVASSLRLYTLDYFVKAAQGREIA